MKKIIFNDNNLDIEDIEDRVIKARIIMLNKDRKVYISSYADIYLFPGGKVERGEDICECARREVKEETGIELDLENEEPFLLVQQFIKDYPQRVSDEVFSNKLNETYYYLIHTNEVINNEKMDLMENELKNNFHTDLIGLDEISELLDNNNTINPRNKYFSREIYSVVKEVQDIMSVRWNVHFYYYKT